MGHQAIPIEVGELFLCNIQGKRNVMLATNCRREFKSTTARVFGGPLPEIYEVPWESGSLLEPLKREKVKSSSSTATYVKSTWELPSGGRVVTCSCPGYAFRGSCKHT